MCELVTLSVGNVGLFPIGVSELGIANCQNYGAKLLIGFVLLLNFKLVAMHG